MRRNRLARTLSFTTEARTIVLPPMALRLGGLHGKTAFAEQVNLIGQDANVISNIELTAGKP